MADDQKEQNPMFPDLRLHSRDTSTRSLTLSGYRDYFKGLAAAGQTGRRRQRGSQIGNGGELQREQQSESDFADHGIHL